MAVWKKLRRLWGFPQKKRVSPLFRTREIEGLGEIIFQKKSRSKRLRMTVRPFKGVMVSLPQRMSYAVAEQWVFEKKKWILEQRLRVEGIEKNLTFFTPRMEFQTRYHELSMREKEGGEVSVRLWKGKIEVCYPRGMKECDPKVQAAARMGIERAWRKEAKEILPGLTRVLAEEYGFTFLNITIKNTRSRWGSCSARNNINLSLHLMSLPERLIRYVILHELVHTNIKNHSASFWKALKKVSPNSENLRKELKQHHIGIY